MTTIDTDIAVAGAGPVGLAAAAALAERGWRVLVVDPAHDGTWANNFGVWEDRLPHPEAAGRRWSRARLWYGDQRVQVLDRPYVRVRNGVLQGLLTARIKAANGRFIGARVSRSEARPDGVSLHTNKGTVARARLVIDATGHSACLVERAPARAWQVAYGIDVDLEGYAEDPDTLGLMDWRPATPGDDGPPSFLYEMPLGGRRVFIEETSLASDPPLSMPLLRARLEQRIRRRGWRVRSVHAVERCRIPLDAGLPAEPEGVVAIGGAAAQVHPATGYQLTRGLQTAQRLAEALPLDGDSATLTRVARGAVWSMGARANRLLHLYGLDVVLGLDADATRSFFQSFFSTGEAGWRTMLDADASPLSTAATMLKMLTVAPSPIRRSLFSASAARRAVGLRSHSHLSESPVSGSPVSGSAGLPEEIPWRSP